MSKYIELLDVNLAKTRRDSAPFFRALRLAAFRARHGDTDAARVAIDEVRAKLRERYRGDIVVHANFAEGICEFMDRGIESALQKFSRAIALSSTCDLTDDIPSLSRGWAAGCYRYLARWPQLAQCIDQITSETERLSSEACSRASLVIADTMQEIEDISRANFWYRSTHLHTLDCGDDSVLAAMLYNRAAMRVFNARIAEMQGDETDIEECHLSVQAASAANYSQHSGDSSVHWVYSLLFGQLLMLKGDCVRALASLESSDLKTALQSWPSAELVRASDVLRCRSACQQITQAEILSHIERIKKITQTSLSAGDAAISLHSTILALNQMNHSIASDIVELRSERLSEYLTSRQVAKDFVVPAADRAVQLVGHPSVDLRKGFL